MTESSQYQKLRAHLAFLRMAAAAEALPGELDHAIKTKLSHQDFLERLLAVEVAAVDERRQMSLSRFASLPSPFTLSDFDFSAQPSVDRKLIDELATLRFVEDATNVLLIGPPDLGERFKPNDQVEVPIVMRALDPEVKASNRSSPSPPSSRTSAR